MYAHHKFNEHATVGLVADNIAQGRSAALISDAGTPGISDPGFLLVRACLEVGEVLGGDVHTLADTIAAPKDMASEIVRKERITDLKQAIGINDKFLLLRDLFGGDTERYERTIDRLNEFDDLDDCIIYISENYDWNPSSDGVRFLMELLERKLS